MAPVVATGTTFAVHVTLSHATGLASSDVNGKSDPYVSFSVDGQHKKSSCRPSTCDPMWTPHEHFAFQVSDPERKQLTVHVHDHDLSNDDLLGSMAIPLKEFLEFDTDHGKRKIASFKSFTLQQPKDAGPEQATTGQLYLSVSLVPLDQADITLEMWENESWVLGRGWRSGEIGIIHTRAKWSAFDNHHSSKTFEAIAPKTPHGYESGVWSYSRGLGDADVDGWYYATTFAGPWYGAMTFTATVRRRKWENVCRPIKNEEPNKPASEPEPTKALEHKELPVEEIKPEGSPRRPSLPTPTKSEYYF